MTDDINLIFGKYALIRRLALGGMGEVFLARQSGNVAGTERLVILKSLLPELAEQDGFIDQFLDEARVASKLNHPNVVQMLEAGQWNGIYFIAMEYIRGENLSRIIKLAKQRGIAVPMHVVVRIARDALLGLGYAHTARDEMTGQDLAIIHRDVSPQNIMVRVDGVTKVVDFGIAKAGNRSSRTATGVLKGKIQYMAPEQVKSEEMDARADQFAMGVVLWEMVTGERLFKGDNEIHVIRAVLTQDIPAPSTIVAGFPPDLEAAIMRMLERETAKRFPSCEDAADALTSWLNQGSRRVAEADVARWVQEVAGEDLDDVMRNLTPSAGNFLIGFQNASVTGTAPPQASGESTLVRRDRRKQRVGLVAAATAIGGLALAGIVELSGLGGTSPEALPIAPLTHGQGPGARPAPAVVASAPRLEAGKLVIQLDEPVGATVLVDDVERAEKVPVTLRDLTPGAHRIVVVSPDGARQDVPFVVPAPVVLVVTDPPGASVLGDGAPLGLSPLETDRLPPGNHEVVARLDGYTPVRETLKDLLPGERRELKLKLERAKAGRPRSPSDEGQRPAEGAACFGSLTINTTPWSRVTIDGEPYGTTPLFVRRISGGTHRVTFESEAQGIKVTKSVTATCDTAVKVNFVLN